MHLESEFKSPGATNEWSSPNGSCWKSRERASRRHSGVFSQSRTVSFPLPLPLLPASPGNPGAGRGTSGCGRVPRNGSILRVVSSSSISSPKISEVGSVCLPNLRDTGVPMTWLSARAFLTFIERRKCSPLDKRVSHYSSAIVYMYQRTRLRLCKRLLTSREGLLGGECRLMRWWVDEHPQE